VLAKRDLHADAARPCGVGCRRRRGRWRRPGDRSETRGAMLADGAALPTLSRKQQPAQRFHQSNRWLLCSCRGWGRAVVADSARSGWAAGFSKGARRERKAGLADAAWRGQDAVACVGCERQPIAVDRPGTG